MAARRTEQVATLQRQLDEATRRAESLRRVIETISGELALAPLLTRIIQSAVELIGADDGAIGLVVEKADGPVVRSVAAYNLPQIQIGQEIRPGAGLSGRVLQEQRPIRLDRYSDLEQTALPEPDDYAVIGMPIWWAGRMIGFFGIGAAPPRHFDEQDVETLELFARHAAIAMENARRYEEESRRTEQLTLIARIGRTLTADLPLDELLQSAAEAIHELLGYPNVAIPLIDPEDPNTLVISIFGGAYRTVVGGVHRMPITEGIMGEAVRTRQVQLVNDVAADPRYIAPPGVVGIQAELTAPILSGDEVLGVLNVESAGRFSAEDTTSLQIVADQLAAAIVNARLFEAERRRTARIATINRIGQLITSSLSLSSIVQTAAEAIVGQLHFAHVAAAITDRDNPERLVLLAQAGASSARAPAGYHQSIHEGIVGAAASTRQRVLINDVASDPRYLPALGASAIRAELAMPILVSDRLLGVLNVESERPIGEADAEEIAIIADQLAVAMDNARRYEEEQRRNARLELIARGGQRIAAQLDPNELFATTVDELHGRLGYDHAALFLLDPSDPQWLVNRASASRWQGKPPGYRHSIEHGIIGAAARRRRPELVNDMSAEPLGATVTGADEPHAELGMPILLGERLLGVLNVANTPRLGPEDVTAIQIIADQLAVAIENGRLAERGQQLAVLEERRRLARELHDSVTQSLFSMSLLAQVLPELWELDQQEARAGLSQIRDLTRGALAEMRALLFEQRPAALEAQGLAHALREHVTAFERRTGLSITMDVGSDPALPELVEQAFFRIAQEALANIGRHAHARKVQVTLRGRAPVRLLIADDGQGFQLASVGAGRFGLISMQERAAQAGARLLVRSAAGQGAEITVEWPDPER